MKNKTFYIVITTIIFFLLMYDINYISAQNIGINSTGNPPDPSAMLDVSSTTGGVLVPRMTSAQRNAIASPATGLIVFDTNTASFYYYDGSAWVNLGSTGPAGPTGPTGPTGPSVTYDSPLGLSGGTVGLAGASGTVNYGTGTGSAYNAVGTSGQVLTSNGISAPTWTTLSGTSPISVSGGTVGLAGASGTVNYGTGTGSAYNAVGTSGQVLISNGTGAPTWATKYETASMSFALANSLVNPYYYTGNILSHNVFTGSGGWNFSTGTTAVFNPASTTTCMMRYVQNPGNTSFTFPTATTITSLNVIGKFNVAASSVPVNSSTNPTFTVLVVKYSPGTSSVALASTTVNTSGTLLGSSAAINGYPTTTDNVYNISISGPISIAAGDVIVVWFDYVISYALSTTTAVNLFSTGSMTWKQAVQ